MSKSFQSFRSNLIPTQDKHKRDQIQIMNEIIERDHEILEALKDEKLDKDLTIVIVTK